MKIRNKFNCTVEKTVSDPAGRFIIFKVVIEDKVYDLIDIYAPNRDNLTCNFFFEIFIRRLRKKF